LIHLASFERVSGFKVDGWLVKTFGALTTAVGASLITSAFEPEPSASSRALGLGSALSLAGADLVYVGKRRIAPVYLLDAGIELLCTVGWLYSLSQCDSKRPAEGDAE